MAWEKTPWRLHHQAMFGLSWNRGLIPCHPGSNWQNALQDGEDHELLFTVASATDCSTLPFEVIEIGTVTEGEPTVLVVDPEGLHIDGSKFGWNHGA